MSAFRNFNRPVSTREKVVVLLAAALLYMALFYPLVTWGGSSSAVLVAVLAALTGWFFGSLAGLLVGLASIGLNAGLFFLFYGGQGLASMMAGWAGNLLVLAVGYAAGRLNQEISESIRSRIQLDSREQLISLLNLAVRDVLASESEQERYFQLVSRLSLLFSADYAYVLRWNASKTGMTLLAATQLDGEYAAHFEPNLARLQEMTVGARQVILLAFAAPPRLLSLAETEKISLPAHSELLLPLAAGEYQLGFVGLGFRNQRQFSAGEITFAELTGAQIALVLSIGEQSAQICKQLHQASALSKIEQALSETEKVGLEKLLQLIVDSAQELILSAQNVILHLVDSEEQILIPRAVAGRTETAKSSPKMRLGQGVVGQVIATGKSIYISDVQTDPRFMRQESPVKYRSLIVSPIQKGEQGVLGTLSIYSAQAHAFTAGDESLLNSLSVQAAIAIENARLLETTRHDLQELNALYHISRSLAAKMNPQELFEETTRLLWQLFGFYHTQIYTKNSERGTLQVRAASGEQTAASPSQNHVYELKIGDGIVGHVAELGQPFMTNNVEAVVFFVRSPLFPETQSELTVPILVEGQVAGVLDVQEKPPRRFSQRHLNLMIAVADQMAVALQRAALYQEVQDSLRQEREIRAQLIQSERLVVAGRLLASVSHELNNPLQAIQNALFLIKEEETLSEQGRQDLELILAETGRMASLIGRLRSTYRETLAEDFQDTLLNDLIEDVHALTSTYMRHRNIVFSFYPDPNLPDVQVIPDKIRQVILNLFMNAIEAMQSGGELTVHTYHLSEQAQVLITFADTGPGINPAIQSRIFEPFVTDKETGTGLGLTICADIVHQHGGEIVAENNPGIGAVFKIWLPTRRET